MLTVLHLDPAIEAAGTIWTVATRRDHPLQPHQAHAGTGPGRSRPVRNRQEDADQRVGPAIARLVLRIGLPTRILRNKPCATRDYVCGHAWLARAFFNGDYPASLECREDRKTFQRDWPADGASNVRRPLAQEVFV